MKITVTNDHISAAKPLPNSSPIALALRDMGYKDATCTHRFAYFDSNAYPLPEVAISNEIRFDFIAKSGQLQGQVCDQITAFDFDLPIVQSNP